MLLAVLGATDWVDGYIARHFDQGSELGKILDPTADRVLLVAGAVALLTLGLPTGGQRDAVVVLAREVLIAVATVALAVAGARRIDVRVGGQGRDARADVRACRCSSSPTPTTSVRHASSPSSGGDSRSAGSSLGYFAALQVRARGTRRVARRTVGARLRRTGGGCMKAVILAGGEGTRLRPLTSNQPKPMMPIANVPMMEHIVRLLAKHGFDDIVVTVAFLANHIRNYFGDGSEFGVRMRYATEESPLGTAGSVRNAMDELDETFLVISGDVLTDVDLGAVVKQHRAADAFATIALKRVENPVEFGIVITRDDGTIERFLEKPTWGEVFSDTINTGIYVLEPGDLRLHPRGRGRRLLGRRVPGGARAGAARCSAHVVDGYWEDVGTLEAYRTRARRHPRRRRSASRCPASRCATACGSARAPTSRPTPRSSRPRAHRRQLPRRGGRGARAPYTVLGADVVVKADADIERSVVHDHVLHRPLGARLRGAVVGRASDIRDSARIEEDVVIGDECFVGAHAIINPSREDLPVQDGRAGRARHVVDRVGEQGRAHAVRPARRARPRQRRHHVGGRGPARDGVRHRAQEGLGRVHEPRHEPRRRVR